jgi:biotin carboxylase
LNVQSSPTIIFVNYRDSPLETAAAVYAARRCGYSVALLSESLPKYLTNAVCDAELVNTNDIDTAVAAGEGLARRQDVRGVVTWGDRGVELTAQLAQALGLPGPPPAAARLARNKGLMREALAHRPDLIPAFHRVLRRDDLRDGCDTVGFPAILKPAMASGSTGIFRVNTAKQADRAYRLLMAYAATGSDSQFREGRTELVLEHLLTGTEHSIEGLVTAGEVIVAGITDKWLKEEFATEYLDFHPSVLPPETQGVLRSFAREVVRELGFDDCAFHLELRLGEDGPRLLEVAARSAGGHICSHLVPMSSGFRFYENAVKVAVGQTIERPPDIGLHAAGLTIVAEDEGRFDGMDGVEEVLALPFTQHIVLETRIGDEVILPPRDFASASVAIVMFRATSRDDTSKAVETTETLMRPRVVA